MLTGYRLSPCTVRVEHFALHIYEERSGKKRPGVAVKWLLLVVLLIQFLGVQEHPAIVESHYDVRIVGCSGGVGGMHSHSRPLS